MIKNIIMIFAVSFCTVCSQLLLKRASVKVMNSLDTQSHIQYLFALVKSPYVTMAFCLQVVAYLLWLFVIAKTKMCVAFALSGGFLYILLTICTGYFFNEKISLLQWIGLMMITVGIILISQNTTVK